MCGIWGIISKSSSGLFTKDVDLASQMMLYTGVRGTHSTGLALTHYKKPKTRPKIWKTLGGPCFLIQNKAWEDIESAIYKEGGAIFGHGRWATKGNITAKNAHPFIYKHITLVHNGTLQGEVEYAKAEDQKEVEVDSHALCIKIAQEGVEASFKGVSGAYSCILHDQNEGAVWFGHNAERPLFMAETSDRLLIMSEKLALESLMDRNNLGKASDIVSVPVGWMHKFDLDSLKLTKETDVFKTPVAISGPTYYASPSYYEKRSYKQDKKSINFIVDGMTQDKYEYVYSGIAEDQHTVEMRTSVSRPELVGQIGTAEVAYEIFRGAATTYFIRFRDVEWQGTAHDEVVRTLNNKELRRSSWKIILRSENCVLCGNPVAEEDIGQTILKENGSLVCKDCIVPGTPEGNLMETGAV